MLALFCLTAVLALCLQLPAMAEAKEITQKCRITGLGGRDNTLLALDRAYMTAWHNYARREADIRIALPDKLKRGGLYICWGSMPDKWMLYLNDQEIASGDEQGFAHIYVPFTGTGELRLNLISPDKQVASIGELFVLEGAEPPAWVQRWQPTLQKADLMVLVAHPDDDLLFMGGTIPYYAVARGKDVVVSFLTCANSMRRSEMLNALWAMGIRHYPTMGPFRDKQFSTMEKLYASWGEEEAREYVVELVRKYRPEVVVSHDVAGEYGHNAHKAAAALIRYAVGAANDPDLFPQSAGRYGTWNVSKLYLHLFKENAITMDWNRPLESFGGKTAMDVAKLGFSMHRSQRKTWSMEDGGPYDNAHFGLAFSSVGPDVNKDDFFENIAEGL